MSNLPSGWALHSLSELARSGVMADGDWIESKDQDPNGEVRLIQLADIGDGVFLDKSSRFLTLDKAHELGCTFLQPGDVLIARMPDPLGRACIFPEVGRPAVTAVDVCIWRAGENAVNAEWLKYFVNSPQVRAQIALLAGGTTRQRISGGNLKRLELPTPPLSEQCRIVSKLNSLLSRSTSAGEELSRIPQLIERYRQALLEMAFSGSLTAQWRNQSANLERGRDLLDDIRANRLSRAKTTKDRAQIERAFEKENLFPHEDEFGAVVNLPGSWTSCRIGAIGAVCNGSTPSRGQAEYWIGSIPWVSSGEVRNNVIGETRELITEAGFENSSVRLLPKGTVLLAMIGEGKTRGQSAILGIEATINQNVAAVIIDHGMVLPEFLWRWFQLQYQQTRRRGAGNGPKALNCQAVRDLPFVLPPLREQREVVSKLKTAFSIIETSEVEANRALSLLDRLDQATLKKAFRGQLVAQDPNDEPLDNDVAINPKSINREQSATVRIPTKLPRAPREKASMTKSRHDDEVKGRPYLAGILRTLGTSTSVEELFKRSELPVADFYKQLSWEVETGLIRDDTTRLEPT